MVMTRRLIIIGCSALIGLSCSRKSNPVSPPIEGDFPPSSKFAVTLYSPTQSVATGDTFQVRIVLYNVTNVSGCALRVYFPPTLVALVSAKVGTSFFPSDSVISISRIEQDSGRVSFGVAYRNSAPAQSKSGSGTVCVLTGKALAGGNCSLVIDPATLDIRAPDGTLIPNFASLVLENLSLVIH